MSWFVWSSTSGRVLVRLGLVVALVVPAFAWTVSIGPAAAMTSSAFTTSDLNLRAGPRTDHYVKLVMPANASVDLLSGLGRSGFYKIAYAGETGYASADYLAIGGLGSGSDRIDAGWDNAGSARTTSALNLRIGPATTYDIAAVMPDGARVTLTGAAQGGFLGIVYNGGNGWASADYLSLQQGNEVRDPGDGSAGTAYTTSSLNLRLGPSTDNAVLLVMPSGAAVTLTGTSSGGFAGVRYQGTAGWASESYLSDSDASSGSHDGSYTRDEIVAIIYDAADQYGQNRSAMLTVAQCESLLDPNAVNGYSNASGLFQFLPGTWATTPFAGADIFDPVANANAAGWMWSVGRRGEWVC